jgi:uncharacterized protein YjeT (DUF2065 family)
MWHELGIALCLVLVIEGMMPFLAPASWKEMVASIADVDNRTLRIIGFSSMMIGTGLLYIIN